MASNGHKQAGSARRQQSRPDGIVAIVRGLIRDLFDPYRPELHYMRGPGPKWHAKHASAAAGDAAMPAHAMPEAAAV